MTQNVKHLTFLYLIRQSSVNTCRTLVAPDANLIHTLKNWTFLLAIYPVVSERITTSSVLNMSLKIWLVQIELHGLVCIYYTKYLHYTALVQIVVLPSRLFYKAVCKVTYDFTNDYISMKSQMGC